MRSLTLLVFAALLCWGCGGGGDGVTSNYKFGLELEVKPNGQQFRVKIGLPDRAPFDAIWLSEKGKIEQLDYLVGGNKVSTSADGKLLANMEGDWQIKYDTLTGGLEKIKDKEDKQVLKLNYENGEIEKVKGADETALIKLRYGANGEIDKIKDHDGNDLAFFNYEHGLLVKIKDDGKNTQCKFYYEGVKLVKIKEGEGAGQPKVNMAYEGDKIGSTKNERSPKTLVRIQ